MWFYLSVKAILELTQIRPRPQVANRSFDHSCRKPFLLFLQLLLEFGVLC